MQPPDTCVCALVSTAAFMLLVCTKFRHYTQILLHCVILLYFHEIIKYVATVRMLILKRERENSLLLFPHSKRY